MKLNSSLFTALVMTLAAVLWWLNCVKWGWDGIQVLTAGMWSLCAVLWWVKYAKSRK